MHKLDELIQISIRDIRDLYPKRRSLDRAWKGTLVTTIAQYLCAYHSRERKMQIPSKKISSMYVQDMDMSYFVRCIINTRNDVCHRCGMPETNNTLNDILSDNRLYKLLEMHGIISKTNNIDPAKTMAGE